MQQNSKHVPSSLAGKAAIFTGTALVATFLSMSSAHAASCNKPAFSGNIPDGGSATEVQMASTRDQINQFVSASEAYIGCIGSDKSSERLRNETIDEMEKVAAVFNRELRKYKRNNR